MVVRTLRSDSADDVETYRTIHLASLSTDPIAFGSTYEREVAFSDDDWRRRLPGFDGRLGVTFVDEVLDVGAEPLAAAGIGTPSGTRTRCWSACEFGPIHPAPARAAPG